MGGRGGRRAERGATYPAKRNDLELFCNRRVYIDTLRVGKTRNKLQTHETIFSIDRKRKKGKISSLLTRMNSILHSRGSSKVFFSQEEFENVGAWKRMRGRRIGTSVREGTRYLNDR